MVSSMGVLQTEISLHETMLSDLERDHYREWVLIRGAEFVGTFASFEEAGSEAVKRFGRGPCLIRKIGAPPLSLPPTAQHLIFNGNDRVRL